MPQLYTPALHQAVQAMSRQFQVLKAALYCLLKEQPALSAGDSLEFGTCVQQDSQQVVFATVSEALLMHQHQGFTASCLLACLRYPFFGCVLSPLHDVRSCDARTRVCNRSVMSVVDLQAESAVVSLRR